MTDSPLQFPCDFPIKAMGEAGDDFRDLVAGIVRRHAADLDESLLRVQASRSGRYQSVTVVVRATSRQQLDAIYRDLTAHVRVVMVL
ncbi:MAG: DUF493 domain-containing protein [Pseudomonadota bacterium]|nr:DUF493 domain-containing protein [Pseudomonadota bacterium]